MEGTFGRGEVQRYKGTSFKTERPKGLSIGGKVRSSLSGVFYLIPANDRPLLPKIQLKISNLDHVRPRQGRPIWVNA